MFVNAMPRYEILNEDAMDVLDRGWRRLVSEIGIEFLMPEAVTLLRSDLSPAGARYTPLASIPR